MKTKQYAVPEGCKITWVAIENNKVIVKYECAEPRFKKGDFLTWLGVPIIFNSDNPLKPLAYLTVSSGVSYDASITLMNLRLATPEEKQLLLDKMRENGKDFDFEKLEVVDYVEMIEEGQRTFYIKLEENPGRFIFDYTNNTRRRYDSNDFKTEQLAQTACDKLNEVLTTLKHY